MSLRAAFPVLVASLCLTAAAPALGLYCEHGVIERGDSTRAVRSKCGLPFEKQVELPARRGGHVVEGAVRVERWAYRRSGGAVYRLRFVADKLVEESLEVVP